MLRQKCSYKNDIETRKKPKLTEICNATKTNKSQVTSRKCLYMMTSVKNITSHSKSFYCFLERF